MLNFIVRSAVILHLLVQYCDRAPFRAHSSIPINPCLLIIDDRITSCASVQSALAIRYPRSGRIGAVSHAGTAGVFRCARPGAGCRAHSPRIGAMKHAHAPIGQIQSQLTPQTIDGPISRLCDRTVQSISDPSSNSHSLESMSEEKSPLDLELANLQKLNGVIENVIAALDASTINTENVNGTVQNADKLLDLWIRVLARSDQAQELILDEGWHGATSDLQAIENEQSQASRKVMEQQQAQARREQEERDLRERKEREEAERLSSSSSGASRMRTTSTRGRSASGSGRGTVKKEVVSAYAQTARPKAAPAASARPSTTSASTTTSARSASATQGPPSNTSAIGRGRGVPVMVRGTRASRGRQQGLGRSTTLDQGPFK